MYVKAGTVAFGFLVLVLMACSSPVRSLSAQASLSGVVRDSARGSPVSNVQIALIRDTLVSDPAGSSTRLESLSDRDGEFRFPDLPAGTYVLHARFIGYTARSLPVKIEPGQAQFMVIRMSGMDVCLGHCPPDPIKLAYAREHRSEWGCQTEDPKVIESLRQQWVRDLAEHPLPLPESARNLPPLPRDSAQLADLIRHVTNRKQCQRAGQVYDEVFGATDTRFLVYRAGPILVVTVPWGGNGTLVLDRNYRVLIRYIVE